MLSERERQALDEIERSISRSDPRLATVLRTARTVWVMPWDRLAHDLVAIVSALSAVLCFALGQIGAGMVAALFAVVVVAVRRMRFPRPQGRHPRPSRPPLAR